MLKGISKIVSPELVKVLCEMGHGDEIVIADGNFPSENFGKRVIRADGISGTAMLDACLQLIPLDTYSDPNFILMQLMDCDKGRINPVIWEEYKKIASAISTDSSFMSARKTLMRLSRREKRRFTRT